MDIQHLQALISIHDSYSGITPQNVKSVLLNPLNFVDHPNPLECLLIVDDFLSNQSFPNSPYSRNIALVEILISIIREQLIHHRKAMEIPCHPPDATRPEAFGAIRRDVRTGNRQLIGWTWVYYGYIRIDLDITQQMFAQQTRFDDRSIRRYQDATFLHITDILLHKEAIARRSQVLASEALIKRQFAGDEITVTLKAQTILQIIRSDQSLLYAFLELFEAIKMDENAVFNVESHLLHN